MSNDNVTAFEITNLDGFYESIAAEAFTDSALLVGKSFFRKNKKDMNVFKKHVIDKRDILTPKPEYILNEIMKCVFSTAEHKEAMFILPKDMEYLIGKISNDITYNIMSHLTDNDILEMCYSPTTEDVIWRIKK